MDGFFGYQTIRSAILLQLLVFGWICVDRSAANVTCGGHFAPACQDCPIVNGVDYGSGYCNGECNWESTTDECVPLTKSCGTDGLFATVCSSCPVGSCDSDDCTFHTRTQLCRDAFSDEVRTASTHLMYQVPSSVTQPAWYFQKVVPTALEDATYVMTNGFQYGYGGIQRINSNRGAVLFSIWDHCDEENDENCPAEEQADLVFCGEGVNCGDFGGEGTGRKSIRYIEGGTFPVVGEEYYFVTQAHLNEEISKMEYTGYFYDNGTWTLMSRLMVGALPRKKWWFTNMHSFLEQWTNVDTTKDRAAMYGPCFVADTDGTSLEQIVSATFTHGTLENHEHVNARFEEAENAITMETGGTAVPEASNYDVFPYNLNAVPGVEFLDFQSRIQCLNQADTAGKINECLEEVAPTTANPTKSPTAGPGLLTPEPTFAPTECSNKAGTFTVDGVTTSCRFIADSKRGRRKKCKGMYKRKCPGLCKNSCLCHDYEFIFQERKRGNRETTCAEVAAMPNRQRVNKCKRVTVAKNCPNVCTEECD